MVSALKKFTHYFKSLSHGKNSINNYWINSHIKYILGQFTDAHNPSRIVIRLIKGAHVKCFGAYRREKEYLLLEKPGKSKLNVIFEMDLREG